VAELSLSEVVWGPQVLGVVFLHHPRGEFFSGPKRIRTFTSGASDNLLF
jgi:hypothetical protein